MASGICIAWLIVFASPYAYSIELNPSFLISWQNQKNWCWDILSLNLQPLYYGFIGNDIRFLGFQSSGQRPIHMDWVLCWRSPGYTNVPIFRTSYCQARSLVYDNTGWKAESHEPLFWCWNGVTRWQGAIGLCWGTIGQQTHQINWNNGYVLRFIRLFPKHHVIVSLPVETCAVSGQLWQQFFSPTMTKDLYVILGWSVPHLQA